MLYILLANITGDVNETFDKFDKDGSGSIDTNELRNMLATLLPSSSPPTEKDVQDARNYAATNFARDVLSVADNLARALDHVPDELRDHEKAKNFISGIEATQRELEKVFASNGITRIAAKGMPLDPNQHQAMMEVPSDEVEPGTIVQEMQAGYMIKDRLLRPAMVGVAKKPD